MAQDINYIFINLYISKRRKYYKLNIQYSFLKISSKQLAKNNFILVSNSEDSFSDIKNLSKKFKRVIIENGILNTNDIKREISTDLKFKKDKIINTLQLVSRDEFEVLKKNVQKQDATIKKLMKTKSVKKAKRS